MKININEELENKEVIMEGAENVKMRVLIGPEDKSDNIIMRKFTILPGGNTPKHSHDFEHIVKFEKGNGIFLDSKGNKHEVNEGKSLFVPSNEEHQFQNPSTNDKEFQFLCIILNPDRKDC